MRRDRSMVRNWKVKALLQLAFSHVPEGHRLNYFFQRHVTHGYPVSDAFLRNDIELAQHHVAQYEKHGGRPLALASFFEFGAGWDLAMPLALHRCGVERQIVVDLTRLARYDLVVDAARRVDAEFSADAAPLATNLDDLLSARGIEYRAPADARASGLAAKSIDCITSTNTLEHIPPDDIVLIYRELHRVLRDDGVLSFQIDYQDHYSYFDPTISAYNFLQYDERAWRRYNPSLHYQNRLRHRDHLAILEAAGFTVVEEQLYGGSDDDHATIASMTLASEFRARSVEELAVLSSRLTLQKRSAEL